MYTGDLLKLSAYTLFSNALVIAGIILLVVYIRKRKLRLREMCEFKLPREQAFQTSFMNVGGIIFLVFSALTILLNLIPAEVIS